MKLPAVSLTLNEQLFEFDIWITPSLGEIRDTDKYQEEMGRIVEVFEMLGTETNSFASLEDCQPKNIAASLQEAIANIPTSEAAEKLDAFASLLYLVTGKSNNKAKCQLPIFLRDHSRFSSLPVIRSSGLNYIDIPRVLNSDRYMRLVADLHAYPNKQSALLLEFVEFILSDEDYISQLWSIGHSYYTLKEIGRGQDLLSPLVVFKVRGSVSASGGHDPEDILRERLEEWGLIPDVDFNLADVTPASLVPEAGKKDGKTRAYDFVLPYQTDGWQPQLFIQCQFYAGDSGSVSHKNVDQTPTSRQATSKLIDEPSFIEYVDGAGYFASLNGDLRHLLDMSDTKSFFQIRSAPIRLRRELQAIGFLTPLEVEHAILQVGTSLEKVTDNLLADGYAQPEIERSISQAIDTDVLEKASSDQVTIRSERAEIVRRYFLLDVIAIQGKKLLSKEMSGQVMIPGYGAFYGVKFNEAIKAALEFAPQLRDEWNNPELWADDLQWLLDRRFALLT